MAGRLASALEVFDKYAYRGRNLVEQQKVDEFNSASNGAIVINNTAMTGDFDHNAGWARLASLVSNIDVGQTIADETPVPLTQYDEKAVHVAHGSKSVSFEALRLEWIGLNQRVAGAAVGQQVGVGMVKNKVNCTIGALVACIGSLPAAVTNNQGTTAADANNISLDMLLQARGKMGDKLRDVRAWIMHSAAWTRYTRKNVKDYTTLYSYDGVAVFRDPLDTRFIITDDPALKYTHSSQDKYNTLGLVSNAVQIYDDGRLITNMEVSNRTMIQTTLKTEAHFGIRLRGNSWNDSVKYPTIAQLSTASNWTLTTGLEVAEGPGILLKSQAAA